jgi:hypothetical protein
LTYYKTLILFQLTKPLRYHPIRAIHWPVCGTTFICDINTKDGWGDKLSFELSTQNNTNATWSWISSQGMDVVPNENYEILAHMKLNKWATQSHILLEWYNESSQDWYQIVQCPSGINGPMEWKDFDCRVTIPPETDAMVLILNAGWSSQ